MKRTAIISISLLLASPSAFSTTSGIDIRVHDVEVYQAQDGANLTQRSVIAHVNEKFSGNAKIYVNNSKIYQKQQGQNGTQSATIATICENDCTRPFKPQ